MNNCFPVILVPQGREYQAVLKGIKGSSIEVIPIPIGKACIDVLKKNNIQQESILLMGVAGSLSAQLQVGDVVGYQSCFLYQNQQGVLAKKLTCANFFADTITSVQGLTSDLLIATSERKQKLSKYAQVVDMESYYVLELFPTKSIKVLRVISDNFQQNLPDLNCAIKSDGKIDSLALALAMLREPQASAHLIYGSIKALSKLEALAGEIIKLPQFHSRADGL
ncbi:MAG: phosphorylase [Cyanobacteriota bacterium ELA615]